MIIMKQEIQCISICFRIGRERLFLHAFDILLYTFRHTFSDVGELTEKLRLESLRHSKCIRIDEYLSVSSAAGTDTDGGSFHHRCHLRGKSSRYFLKCDCTHACIIKRKGILYKSFCLCVVLCPQTISAELVYAE